MLGDEPRRLYPERPIASTHAAIVSRGRVLLVRRANEPNRGRWGLPGGVVQLGESLGEAVRREVLEECGLDSQPLRILDVVDQIVRDEHDRVRYHYVVVFWLAEVISGEPQAGSDALGVRWVSEEDLGDVEVTEISEQVVWRVLASLCDGREGGSDGVIRTRAD